MKRLRFEVRKTDDGGWGLFPSRARKPVWSYRQKRLVVFFAADDLARAWDCLAVRSELVIKSRDGRIQDTRTYGDDPRRTKG